MFLKVGRLPFQYLFAICFIPDGYAQQVFPRRQSAQWELFPVTSRTLAGLLHGGIPASPDVVQFDAHIGVCLQDRLKNHLLTVRMAVIANKFIFIRVPIPLFSRIFRQESLGTVVRFPPVAFFLILRITAQTIILLFRRIIERGGEMGGFLAGFANGAVHAFKDRIAVPLCIPTPGIDLILGRVVSQVAVLAVTIADRTGNGIQAGHCMSRSGPRPFEDKLAGMYPQDMMQGISSGKNHQAGGIRSDCGPAANINPQPVAIIPFSAETGGKAAPIRERKYQQGFGYPVSDPRGGVFVTGSKQGNAG